MPEWIRPEFHELEEDEINEMLDTEEISKPSDSIPKWQRLIGIVLIGAGLLGMAFLLLTY